MKFELTEKHINLCKHLNFIVDNGVITTKSGLSPFGGVDIYEDIDLIVNGKPDDFDPMSIPDEFSDRIKAEYDALFSELTTALPIILMYGHKPGVYKKRSYESLWVPIK